MMSLITDGNRSLPAQHILFVLHRIGMVWRGIPPPFCMVKRRSAKFGPSFDEINTWMVVSFSAATSLASTLLACLTDIVTSTFAQSLDIKQSKNDVCRAYDLCTSFFGILYPRLKASGIGVANLRRLVIAMCQSTNVPTYFCIFPSRTFQTSACSTNSGVNIFSSVAVNNTCSASLT